MLRNHGLCSCIFFGGILLGATRFLWLVWFSPVAVGWLRVNMWILSVPGMIGASSISLGSLRITSNFWNNVVIEEENWSATLQKSSAGLMIIWPDLIWRNKFFICATYVIYGLFTWWVSLWCIRSIKWDSRWK